MSGDPWISAPHRPKAAVTGSFGDRRGNGNDPDRDFLSIGDAWDTVSYLCTKIETQGGGAIHCQCVRSLHMSKNAICDTPRRRHGESPDLTPAFREPRSSSISPRRPDVSRWSWRTAGILIRSGAHRAISPRRAGHVMPPTRRSKWSHCLSWLTADRDRPEGSPATATWCSLRTRTVRWGISRPHAASWKLRSSGTAAVERTQARAS